MGVAGLHIRADLRRMSALWLTVRAAQACKAAAAAATAALASPAPHLHTLGISWPVAGFSTCMFQHRWGALGAEQRQKLCCCSTRGIYDARASYVHQSHPSQATHRDLVVRARHPTTTYVAVWLDERAVVQHVRQQRGTAGRQLRLVTQSQGSRQVGNGKLRDAFMCLPEGVRCEGCCLHDTDT